MFTLHGRSNRFCDSVSRRDFLRVGALGFAGLTLADLYRLEAATGGSSGKSLINIFLAGGPPHTDMFDLKPDAPAEFRGEFSPINTNVPGMQICQLMPKLAKLADKFSIVRSLVGSVGDHSSFQSQTGYDEKDLRAVGGRPSIGSVVAKMSAGHDRSAPAFVSLMGEITPGFLGPVYKPFQPDGAGRSNLKLGSGMTQDRLSRRTELLKELDSVKRQMDASGQMEAMDVFTQRAVEVVTSGKLADALDLEKEDPKVRERYTGSTSRRDGETDRLLLARRLVEAGVRTVSLSWGGFDTHSKNFDSMRKILPKLDMSLSALITDLYERSMLNDVTIVMWGEFGRTPRVNKDAGRDHWERVGSVFLAGGGMKGGQVIGKTDRTGGEPVERPVHWREVFATMYNNLGIDPRKTQINDPAGRPQYLVDNRDPIRELL